MRRSRRRVAPGLPGAAAVFLALCAASPARAQERIERTTLPDLDRSEPLWLDRHDEQRAQLLVDTTALVGHAPDCEPVVGGGHARLRWGTRQGMLSLVHTRSELAIAAAGAEPAEIEGRHDAHAVIASSKRSVGVDLDLDGRIDHLGLGRRATAAPDRGPGALLATSLSVVATPYFKEKPSREEGGGLALPLGMRVARIAYRDEGAPIARSDTVELSSMIAARVVERGLGRGVFGIIGVSHAMTRKSLPANAVMDELPEGVETDVIHQTRLRIGDVDMAVISPREHLGVAARGTMGWSWLRAPGRAENLFTMHYGAFVRGKKDGAVRGFGLAFSRDGMATADGRRFIAEARIEAQFEWLTKNFGGTARGAVSWLDDIERSDEEDPGLITRLAFHGELFQRLAGDLQAGVFQLVRHEPRFMDWDPWQQPRGLDVEMGLFLRWSAGL